MFQTNQVKFETVKKENRSNDMRPVTHNTDVKRLKLVEKQLRGTRKQALILNAYLSSLVEILVTNVTESKK